jgi:predicted ester cyclase
MGEPPTRQTVTWTEIHIYRMRDGKIAEHWVELDRLGLFTQVGLVSQGTGAR